VEENIQEASLTTQAEYHTRIMYVVTNTFKFRKNIYKTSFFEAVVADWLAPQCAPQVARV
jgi:hypothetical protein